VTVCLPYQASQFPYGSPRLMHFTNGAWADVTTSTDTTNMIVCGQVSSLSPLALGAPNTPTASISGLPAGGTYGTSVTGLSVSTNSNGVPTSVVSDSTVVCTVESSGWWT